MRPMSKSVAANVVKRINEAAIGGSLRYPPGVMFHYDADKEKFSELTRGRHAFNHSILAPQYEKQKDGSTLNVGAKPTVDVIAGFKGLRGCGVVQNLLTNSVFAGAVSGTPGTAPTGWSDAGTVGSLEAVTGGLKFTASASNRSIREVISVSASTVYRFGADCICDGSVALNDIIRINTRPAGSTFQYTVDGVAQAESYVPAGGLHTLAIVLTVSTTAGTPLFLIGCGITSGSATGTVTISSPQITATAYPQPYVPTTASGPVTQPASNATTTNGCWFSMPQYLDAETNDGQYKRSGIEKFILGNIDVTETTAWTPLKTIGDIGLGPAHIIEIVVDSISGGNLYVYCQNTSQTAIITSPGTYKYISTPNGTAKSFALTPSATGMTVKTSKISLQSVIPATQLSEMWKALDGEPDGVEKWDDSLVTGEAGWTYSGSGMWICSGGTADAWMTIGGVNTDDRVLVDAEVISYTSGACAIKVRGGVASVLPNTIGRYKLILTAGEYAMTGFDAITAYTGTVKIHSIQRIQPQPLTIATRVMMGVGSADLPNSTLFPYLSCLASQQDIDYGQKGSTGIVTIIKSYDKTNVAYVSGDILFQRNAIIRRVTQVNTAGTQFRVGYMIEGTHTAIQWSSWAAFDGSFGPSTLYRLMLGYNNAYPMWYNKITAWRKQVSDSELLEAWAA